MENYTYNFSREYFCIAERSKPKISMSELFNMVSGTSTGSLLTSAIVLPNPDNATKALKPNKFFADDASLIYIKHGKDVF